MFRLTWGGTIIASSLLLLLNRCIQAHGETERLEEPSVSQGSVRGAQELHRNRHLDGCTLVKVDFNELDRGDWVGEQYKQSFGLEFFAEGGFDTGLPRVFDTSQVGTDEFGDPDLGSPNERCDPSGPGVGEGGEPDKIGANCVPQGNVLIIQEDNGADSIIPDDNADGGTITIKCDPPLQYLNTMGILDADYGGYIDVEYIKDGGTTTKRFKLRELGDNAFDTMEFRLADVTKITLNVDRSGAITFITFCPGTGPAPTTSPPTKGPVQSPTSAPVPSPTSAPVPSPTSAPVPSPTSAPVPSPTSAPGETKVYETTHIFSIADIMGGFDGSTFGPAGAKQDTTILCGAPGSTAPGPCPETMTDKDGTVLYPIDSEFGFNVLDFVGGQRLTRDQNHLEGFAGDVDGGGVKISNVGTSTYKVKPPLGTWCQGLSSTSVKCSTEHYSVMEHVLSCHEVCPYKLADPVTGEQAVQSFPDGSASFDCANAELDNDVKTISDGQVGDSYKPPPELEPNDNTDVLNDIATSTDYSITLKDDGKALYRWGSLIKLPTDVRLYAKLQLPDEWKAPNADFLIKRAELIVSHQITNNPNDQIRPEDLENEGATGRKPSYAKSTLDGVEVWTSRVPCFEGDGDFIDGDDGVSDPDFLPEGTVFKGKFKGENLAAENPPQLFSEDLVEGFTNGWYTSLNRDPFEWSYRDATQSDAINDFVGFSAPLTEAEMAIMNLELVSGPRWRLKANKFGQDLPGLEIPKVECSAPPFEMDNIKYSTGDETITTINLLDWNEEDKGPSPLSTSKGWVDITQNDFVKIVDTVNGIPISSNGAPMTEDLDLTIYIKGDKKPVALTSVKLVVEYE